MSTLTLEHEPLAMDLRFTEDALTLVLADGRSLTVPLAWYPRLAHATQSERAHWQLLGGGYAVEWPDLDEHIGVAGVLAGRRSGESETSFRLSRQPCFTYAPRSSAPVKTEEPQ